MEKRGTNYTVLRVDRIGGDFWARRIVCDLVGIGWRCPI